MKKNGKPETISILGAKSGTAKAFRRALASAKDGDEILLARVKELPSDFTVHPDGIVFSKGDKILLNGVHCLYQGETEDWQPHTDGIVIRKGYELLLNGERRLYEGHFDDWDSHPSGVLIEWDNKLLLNGTQVLHEGPFDGFFEWHSSPCFPAFLEKDASGYLLGGNRRLTSPEKVRDNDEVLLHPDGVVYLIGDEFHLPDGTTIRVKGLVAWCVHRHGILVCEHSGEFEEFRLLVHKTFDADEIIV
jgi:hypothetical protein